MAGQFRFSELRPSVRRGVVSLATLALMTGGVIILASSPASASSTTDTIWVNNDPNNTTVPLPDGTPDVVNPLSTTITTACGAVASAVPVGGISYSTGYQVMVCTSTFPKPSGLYVGTQNAGVVVLPSYFGPSCGVAAYVYPGSGSTTYVGIAPPGSTC